jgi:phage shock protein A
VGSLEGSARELQAARSELAAELAATRTRCTEAIAGLAAAARDAGHAIARGKELEADVAALRANLASLAQQPAHHGVSEKNQKRIRRIVPSESEKLDFAPR